MVEQGADRVKRRRRIERETGRRELSFMSGARPPATAVRGVPTEPSLALVLVAFAAIYVIWGSTYLAIRFAIESIPPLFMAAVRFITAGALLYGWATLRRSLRPSLAQWKQAAVAGALMLGGGNGAVVVAEQWVPSGLAAVLVACVALWLVVLDSAFGAKDRPSQRVQAGLLVGFLGVALLAGAPGIGDGGLAAALGVVLLLGAGASWAAGSLYQRQLSTLPDQLSWIAMQMIAGGGVLALLSLLAGELPDVHPGEVTTRSVAALGYLVVFGSLIAYSAYVWLLRVSTPSRIGTYAYVNPVIALVLGWGLADEPISLRSVGATAIILASVFVIMSEGPRPRTLGPRVRPGR
jgi:drug/metabolite transporter (DMT)-like permease